MTSSVRYSPANEELSMDAQAVISAVSEHIALGGALPEELVLKLTNGV